MGSWNGAHRHSLWKPITKTMIITCQRSVYIGIILIFHVKIRCLLPMQSKYGERKKNCSVKSVRTPDNVARLEGALQRSPTRSARRHAVSLGISDRTVRRTLHKDLHYHPYKIQIVHALKDVDHANRLAFCQQILKMINENPHLLNKLLMSGDLPGFVNKQNFRYWSSENPQRFHEKPLYSAKVTVWCTIS
jgi:hypothetical protein